MRIRRLLPALLIAAALGAPPAALAQTGNPFTPLPVPQSDQQQQAQTAPDAPANVAADDGGLKRWQELALFGGGLILLAGIGWAIMRDARSKAPVAPGELAEATAGRAQHRARVKQRNRARAKAARRSRRHNR